MNAAPKKKNIAIVNKLSSPGRANYKIALKTFIVIPLNPFPNITVAIYLNGITPAKPNIWFYKIPLKYPKINSIPKHDQKAPLVAM